jgi:hypothetical protein
MPRTYGKRKCYVCGDEISTNGLAQSSHKKMHVREGALVEMEVFYGFGTSLSSAAIEYVSPKRARHLLNAATDHRTRVVSGTPALTEEN